MTVHITQIDGDWAVCCDSSVRSLVTVRQELGQSLMKELLTSDGTCGCGAKPKLPETHLRQALLKMGVDEPRGKDDPDWVGPRFNEKPESNIGPSRHSRRGQREDK